MSDQGNAPLARRTQPEIPRSRFALGMAHYPDCLEELRVSRFSDGQETRPITKGGLHPGRFSKGQELLGDDEPEKHIRRSFSEGMERRRTTG